MIECVLYFQMQKLLLMVGRVPACRNLNHLRYFNAGYGFQLLPITIGIAKDRAKGFHFNPSREQQRTT